MIVSYIIYLVPVLLAVIFSILQVTVFKNKEKLGKIIAISAFCFVLLLMCSLKASSVGTDSSAYLAEYEYMKTHTTLTYNGFEKLYVLVSLCFAKIGIPFNGFLLFWYLIIYGCIGFVVFKRSKYPMLALLLIYCFDIPFLMSGLRQSIAIAICLLAIEFFTSKKIWMKIISFALVVVAFFIHSSALIALPFLLAMLLRFKIKYALFVVPFLALMYFVAPYIYQFIFYLFGNLSYPPIDNSGGGQFLFLLVMACIAIYALKISNDREIKIEAINSLNELNVGETATAKKIYFNVDANSIGVWCLVFACLFMSFSTINQIFPRYAQYFIVGSFVYATNYIDIFKSKRNRYIACGVFALIFIAYLAVFSLRTNALSILPYKLFFQ